MLSVYVYVFVRSHDLHFFYLCLLVECVCVHACVRACACVYMCFVKMHVSECICTTCVCVYVCVCVCVFVHMSCVCNNILKQTLSEDIVLSSVPGCSMVER